MLLLSVETMHLFMDVNSKMLDDSDRLFELISVMCESAE